MAEGGGLGADPGGGREARGDGYLESCHGRLRDVFLERTEFESVAEARGRGSWLRREDDAVRPHGSWGYPTPKEFSAACDREGGRAELRDSLLMT